MPTVLSLSLLDRLPVPSLRNYSLFSLLLLLCAVGHVYRTVTWDESWHEQLESTIAESALSNTTKQLLNRSVHLQMIYYAVSDQACVWVQRFCYYFCSLPVACQFRLF